MSKTTVFAVLVSLALVLSGVLLGAATRATAPNVDSGPSTATQGARAAQSLLQASALTLHEALATLAMQAELQRVVDPTLLPQRHQPMLRPDRPPEAVGELLPAPRDELLTALRTLLQSEAQRRGLFALALVERKPLGVLAGVGDEEALRGLLDLVGSGEGASRSGFAHLGSRILQVGELALGQHPNFVLLAARELDPATLASLRTQVGGELELSLFDKGELVYSSDGDAKRRAELAKLGAELRSADAIAKASGFGKPRTFGEQELLAGLSPLPALAGDGSLALVTSSVRDAARTTEKPGLGELPVQLWIAAGLGFVFLLAIALLLSRHDASAALERTRAQILELDDPEDARLSPAARRLVETIGDQLRRTTKPAPSATPAADQAHLQEEIDALASRLKQSQSQLDFARSEHGRLKRELDEASGGAREARERSTELEAVVAALRQDLEHARASAGPRLRPLAEMERLAQDAPPAEANAKPTEPPSTAVREYPSVEVKEFDTAEVSGEEMSQLLEEIDRGAPVPTHPVSGDAEVDSLAELAARIGKMSEAELAKLDGTAPAPAAAPSAPETTRPRADAMAAGDDDWENASMGLDDLGADSAKPASAGDAARTTAEMWRIPSASSDAFPRVANDDPGRTLTGGLRMRDDDGFVAPPPWRKDAEPPQSLSPTSLLEALKRRGQSPADAPSEPTEATRVSALSRSFTEAPSERPKSISQSGVFTRTGSRVDVEPTNDADYFKSLYEEFLETKRRCNEPVEKITLERFINRLARNKQALVERYDCRTVRFQVYVKDGRAALKATPVK